MYSLFALCYNVVKFYVSTGNSSGVFPGKLYSPPTTHSPPAELLAAGFLIDVAPFPRLPFLGNASAFPTINLNAPLCIVGLNAKCENTRWPNRCVRCSHKTG